MQYDINYIRDHAIGDMKMLDEYNSFGPFPPTGKPNNELINEHDEFFHDYPYEEIFKSWWAIAYPNNVPCPKITAYRKLRIESAINYNDFKDSLEYICCKIKGDNKRAEEFKQRILDKVAKRKQGYLEIRGATFVDSLVESGLLSAETARNAGNGYIGFPVWNGKKRIEQFQKMI